MLKKLSRSLFCAVVYVFSSGLLIISLLVSIRITALWDEVTSVQHIVDELKEENTRLTNEYESSISLEEIENYATTQLGMCRCTNEQIEYIVLK